MLDNDGQRPFLEVTIFIHFANIINKGNFEWRQKSCQCVIDKVSFFSSFFP